MPLSTAQGSAANINHGSDTSLDNLGAFSVSMLVKFASPLTTFSDIASKGPWLIYLPGTATRIQIDHLRATQVLRYRTNDNAVAAGTWYFIALTVDQNGAASSKVRIYIGTRTQPMAEQSYNLQQDGTGAFTTDAPDSVKVGAQSSAVGASFAAFNLSAGVLDLGQLRKWQKQVVRFGSSRIHVEYGRNGDGLQHDRSPYGNHGTVTSATFDRAAELDYLFRPRWVDPVDVPAVRADEPYLVAQARKRAAFY